MFHSLQSQKILTIANFEDIYFKSDPSVEIIYQVASHKQSLNKLYTISINSTFSVAQDFFIWLEIKSLQTWVFTSCR